MRSGEVLTYQEIKAWSELNNVKLTPEEVGVLRRLDIIYQRISYEHYRATTGSDKG